VIRRKKAKSVQRKRAKGAKKVGRVRHWESNKTLDIWQNRRRILTAKKKS